MKTAAGRCCVFCGSPANSREHVFAKRLCRRAEATDLAVVPGLLHKGHLPVTRPKHLLSAHQVRHVCKSCNNTWMNDLEAWFEQRLGCLIEPLWPEKASAMIEQLKPETSQLARWLLKTAITFNYACIKGTLSVEFPQAVAHSLKAGVLPPHCWVDLAYSKYPTVSGAISKGFRVINGGHSAPNQIPSPAFGFRFAVQFNHLLLRIALAPGAHVTYESWHGEMPVRLYPEPWAVTPKDFAYEDLMKFEHSVVLETHIGCTGNIV